MINFLKDSPSKYVFPHAVLILQTITKDKKEQDQFIGFEA